MEESSMEEKHFNVVEVAEDKRLTWEAFNALMGQNCKTRPVIRGVIVFTESSWNELYPLESRSYYVNSDAKYFDSDMGGNSIFGGSIDGTDHCKISAYMFSENGWKVDYCYVLE